jgi:hypothetical protein
MQSDSSVLSPKQFPLVFAGLLAMAAVQPAAANDPATDTYTWSAELVAVDEQASTVTVQSRLVSNAEVAELTGGDRAVLVWSGITTAAGVRSVTQGTTTDADRLTLPIEYLSSEHDGRHVRFKVPVPSADLARIAALSPGQWVTATSAHRPASYTEAVVSIRPYGHVG